MGNMPAGYLIIIVGAVVAFLITAGMMKWMISFYVKVPAGSVLIVNRTKGMVDVSFTGGLVLPQIHRGEIMDISAKEIALVREGGRPLLFAGQRPAELRASFTLRVNPTREDILKVAHTLGVERASNLDALRELFTPLFEQALEQTAAALDAEAVQQDHHLLTEPVIRYLGAELDGFIIDDLAIHHFVPRGV